MENSRIYEAKVIFRTAKGKGLSAYVHAKIGRYRSLIKKNVPMPDGIKASELVMHNAQGEMMAVYYRKSADRYRGIDHMEVPTEFGQKLEGMVLSAIN